MNHEPGVYPTAHAGWVARCSCGWYEDGHRLGTQAERAWAEHARVTPEHGGGSDLARRTVFTSLILEHFQSDFLGAASFAASHPDAQLLSPDEFASMATTFVQDWSERRLGMRLDAEQAHAVATFHQDVLAVARAGSGKTRTLVARAAFLQDHCGVPPNQILLLAFNRDAADEILARLHPILGDELPHVMTFHALAYALVHPREDLIFDDRRGEQFVLSTVVQSIVDDLIRDDRFGTQVKALMLAHFREDWERIVDGRFDLPIEEFVQYRRMLPREALQGHPVKSFGERTIANGLFEHGIDYRYEQNVRWSDGSTYRPDFTVASGSGDSIAIEYFGLAGDDDYDDMSAAKRDYWARREGWRLIEYSAADLSKLGERGFTEKLIKDLTACGITARPRTDDEIWSLVRNRAIDTFTNAVTQFVGRSRKRDLSPNELRTLISQHVPVSRAEAEFLAVGTLVYAAYLTRLERDALEDFDGLLARASAAVLAGNTRFVRNRGREHGDVAAIKWLHVDEFQDFSALFNSLISTIRARQPDMKLFCVGDDWQAINGFAGSDLSYFQRFSEWFPGSASRRIASNYRSAKSVVEFSNALMVGLGSGATATRESEGRVRLLTPDALELSETEASRHLGDKITPATLRVVRDLLDRDLDVVLLARQNRMAWWVNANSDLQRIDDHLERFLAHLRSFLPEHDRERVSISTTHRYKGREQQAVVILDAKRNSYPLIHRTWTFFRVFGDAIERIIADERRLFYVAMTRAMNELVILSDSNKPSDFIADLQAQMPMHWESWRELAPVPSLDGPRVTIRVFNAYEVKDSLKHQGYGFTNNSRGKYWSRVEPAAGFSMATLKKQPWLTGDVVVEVVGEDTIVIERLSSRDATPPPA